MDTPEQPAVGRVRREALASSVVAELQPSSGRLQAPGWSAGTPIPPVVRARNERRRHRSPEQPGVPGARAEETCGGEVRQSSVHRN